MDIKYKLYPYPVLASYSDDYKNATFETNIEMVKDGYNARIDFVSSLTSNTIKELIRTGKASYVYHLECAQTGFRHVIITQNVEERYPIDKRLVCGKLQVCTFVVAREDLHSYTSSELHEDYMGQSFEIEAGCVLAVGTQIDFTIFKEIDDIANLPSIFSIIKNADESAKEMLVDYECKRILIKLPFNDFFTYKQLSKSPKTLPILNAITVVPALSCVLGEIKRRPPEARCELDGRSWYRTLKKVLLNKFEFDIESETFDDKFDSLELAQKLINSPIPDAFKALIEGDDNGGDEQ